MPVSDPQPLREPWVAGEWLLLHGLSRRDPSPWVLQGWPLPHTDPCPKDLEARVPVSDPQPLREPWVAGEWLLLQGLSRRDPSAVVDLPDRARGPRRVLPAGRAEVALDPQGRASRELLLVQAPCMASRRDPSALQDLPDRARGPRRVLPAGRAELALDPQGRASREPLLVSGPSRRDLQDLPDWARGPRRVLPAGRAEVALEPLLV